MKRITKLSALLAVAAAAPAIVAPGLMATPAQAQDRPEFQDVPTTHWAYPALQKLAAAGVLEGYPPDGKYFGQRPMTRYEFAVAIARLLNKLGTGGGIAGPQGIQGIPGPAGPAGPGVTGDYLTRDQILAIVEPLQREFRDELARLGTRVDALENRMSNVENRVVPAPRLTFAPAILHQEGYASYIGSGPGGTRNFLNPGFNAGTVNGTVNANGTVNGTVNTTGTGIPNPVDGAAGILADNNRGGYTTPRANRYTQDIVDKKFSYTDLELRLTDRVSDRLSLNAALRSLGSNQEDPWAGDSQGNVYVREAYAVADLTDRKVFGFSGITGSVGRQQTKVGLGLLYDNQLSPTDQLRGDARIGPFNISGFTGTQNDVAVLNQGGFTNRADPYATQGAVRYLDTGADGFNQLVVGTPSALGTTTPANDNETLARASVNVFKIAGRPLALGYTRLFDGFRRQEGDSFDVSIPLFNRTIGFEYVRQYRQADGTDFKGNKPTAYNATVNVLRTNILDVNVAYGYAQGEFEYFAASSANPYARSYGQAIFDRPLALGAPLLNPDADGPAFLAAKRALDFNGTLRIPIAFLKRVPLTFRYYNADSGSISQATRRHNLGEVYTVGTKVSVTPGIDVEVKGGRYNPGGDLESIEYLRVGASIGF